MSNSLRQTTMKIKMDVNTRSLDQADDKLKGTAKIAEELEQAVQKTGKAVEGTGDIIENAAKQSGGLSDSFKELIRNSNQANESLHGLSSISQKLRNAFNVAAGFSSQLYDLGKQAKITGVEFTNGMLAVEAAAKKSQQAFLRMRKEALQLSNDTVKSAKDVSGSQEDIAKASKTTRDTITPAVEELKDTYDGLSKNVLSEFTPIVKDATAFLSKLNDKFNDLSPTAKKMVAWGAVIAGGLKPAIDKIKDVISVYDDLKQVFKSSPPTPPQSDPPDPLNSNPLDSNSQNAQEQSPDRETRASRRNRRSGKWGKIRKIAKFGKGIPLANTALAATSLIGMTKETAGEDVGSFVGSAGGGWAGAATGAAIGSVVPGIGTAIGGVIGGIAGSMAGSEFGGKFGKTVQKHWPDIKKKAQEITDKHPIITKALINSTPIGSAIKAKEKFDSKEVLTSKVDFGEGVSKSTAKAYNSYKKFTDKASVDLQYFAFSGDKITKGASEKIGKNFDSAAKVIERNIQKSAKNTEGNLNKLVKSGVLGSKDMEQIQKSQKQKMDQQLKNVRQTNKAIQDATKKASDENLRISSKAESDINRIKAKAQKEGRTLTQKEQKQILAIEKKATEDRKRINTKYKNDIDKLTKQQNKNAAKNLSKSAKEQRTILTTLQHDSTKISAKQAADVVKQSKKAKDGAVKEANKKYKDVVAAADAEYYENGSITKKQHDDIIEKAKSQRDGSVSQAEEMHKKVVEQAKNQAGSHIEQVNWETGETLRKWDQHKIDLAEKVNSITSAINTVLEFLHIPTIPEWKPAGYGAAGDKSLRKLTGPATGNLVSEATGTPAAKGGATLVGEEGVELAYKPFSNDAYLLGANGPEIAHVESGTRILNHTDTKAVMSGGMGKGLALPGYSNGNTSKDDFLSNVKSMTGTAWSGAKKFASATWDTAKDTASAVGDFAMDAAEWMMHPIESTKKLFSKYLPFSAKHEIGNKNNGLGTGILKHLRTGVGDYFKEKFADFTSAGSFSGANAESAKKWISTAMAITNTPPGYLNGLMTIAQKESGFNPMAINLWDSNAKAGHPSQGLFQTIPSTFAAYRNKSIPNSITNPIANAVAAINYMNGRYGSIANVPGLRNMASGKGYVGYKKGGYKDNNLDQVMVGEAGPEIVDLPYGSRVHNNHKTNELLNQQGQPVINFSPTVNVTVQANDGETNESVIQRAVNTALEKAFKDLRGIFNSGVVY